MAEAASSLMTSRRRGKRRSTITETRLISVCRQRRRVERLDKFLKRQENRGNRWSSKAVIAGQPNTDRLTSLINSEPSS